MKNCDISSLRNKASSIRTYHNLSVREEELLDLIDLLIERLSLVDGAREVANEKFRVIYEKLLW